MSVSIPGSKIAPAGKQQRRGSIMLLAAFIMIGFLAIAAMAIDWGYIALTQTELQRAADAGALAGASALANGADAAQAEVNEFITANKVGNTRITTEHVTVDVGDWNSSSRSFSPGGSMPSAIRVQVQRPNQPLFFGKMFGKEDFDTRAEAIAVYQPRDIMLVLDFSGSMNDDSELTSRYDRDSVKANLDQIYAELGSPVYGQLNGTLRYVSSTDTRVIKQTLGLTNVPYPYPAGSWDEYISYVVNRAPSDFRRKYGSETLITYWLREREEAHETPDLWKVSAQPVTAVKDAVDLYLAQLGESETSDRLGFVSYTAADGTALLESSLTTNFADIGSKCRRRQAGHYRAETNISAGMRRARQELQNNARSGAFKMMVLMTDGLANLPGSVANATQAVRDEAAQAKAAGIPIITISLGAGADASIMQEVADLTGGIHFNVPPGAAVSQYEADLKEVFRKIAEHRPLQLVK